MPPEIVRSSENRETIDTSNFSIVVPGQGSQKVGMGKELFGQSKAAREVFGRVDEALRFNLSDLMFNGSPEELQDTVNAQPAIFTLAVATFEALKEQLGEDMIKPKNVAGHSAGEYPILVIDGVLDLESGAKLIRKRGELMQKASLKRPGTMAAIIGLNQSELERLCRDTGVELANINGEEQMVISGTKVRVAQTMDLALDFASKQNRLIKRIPLKVSGAFHSRLMKPVQRELQECISSLEFNDPMAPIISNYDPRPLTTAHEVEVELGNGICLPVNLKDIVRYMGRDGIKTVIELGPKVLSGMVERIDTSLHAFSVDSFDSVQKLAQSIYRSNPNKPLTA